MPSPLAHSAAGWLLGQKFRRPGAPRRTWRGLCLLGGFLLLSLLPDLDAAPGFATGDLGKYHNNVTHSLVVGTLLALAAGAAAGAACGRAAASRWFLIVFLCYNLHVAMDYFTCGRGVMLFWPLSMARFQSPVLLFYGLQWGAGLWSLQHVWTALSELLFFGSLLLLFAALRRGRAGGGAGA